MQRVRRLFAPADNTLPNLIRFTRLKGRIIATTKDDNTGLRVNRNSMLCSVVRS